MLAAGPSCHPPNDTPTIVRKVSFACPLQQVHEVKAEFGFPFWSSDEREIRAWRLSREHAQMRRVSEEQRKGAPGPANGKRKVKTSLCDRVEAEAIAQQLAHDEGHGAQQCSARALEASFATSPAVAAAVDTVESTDTDATRQSYGLTQTRLNQSAAPPSTHIQSSSLRSSWITAPAVASTPAAEPTPAKRKAKAAPSRAGRQQVPLQSIAPAVCTKPASGAAGEPTTAVLTAKVEPVATALAATAVDRHSGLPDGWVCRIHVAPSAKYKRYEGPNGEWAQSLKQAWLLHAAGQDEAECGEQEGCGEEGEDQLVEACIPEGYERLPWLPGQPVCWFMLWQSPAVHSDVQWRFGEVVQALPRHKRFTHDAWLQGMPRRYASRIGVDLSMRHHDVGSWVMLRKKA